MNNYRANKTRIKPNNLGSLYLSKDTNDYKVIYIGGQMAHHGHILEQTGLTFDLGHNMFDGSWFYDYPLNGNKSNYNACNFANNLKQCLEIANLEDVTLITSSFGGLIGSYATDSERIKEVIAIHPPIIGTPLANPEKYIDLPYLTSKERILLKLFSYMLNPEYGFVRDNYEGLNFRSVDFNKLLVVSSKLNRETCQNNLLNDCYDLIIKLNGFKSDGVVVYEEEFLDSIGINYLKGEPELNHFEIGTKEYVESVYTRTRKK